MNELKHKEEFRKVLAEYRLSDTAQLSLQQTKLVLLVGPTSSGRNTIITELLKTEHYHYIVSDTTRKPRINNGIPEQDGREYWFRSEEELLADLQNGQFLEAAIIHNQQVSGISMRELEVAANEGKIAINEIEVIGADNIHALKPDTTFFFIIPPSFDEWMARMRFRGELPQDEVLRRLQSAVMEITMALDRDYYTFLVNDTFVRTAKEIEEIVQTGRTDMVIQNRGRNLAKDLLEDTRSYVQNFHA